LSGIRQTSDGFTALCPAHDDVEPSLHLSIDPDEGVLVHCFRGCSYSEILTCLEDDEPAPTITITGKEVVGEGSSWWQEYTGVPWSEWTSWGMRETPTGVAFTWANHTIEKHRPTRQKSFRWEPSGASTPPLWPEVTDKLPDEIWLTEGESDCGVLRYLGFPAFAITKGAQTPISTAVYRVLRERGVRQIVFCFDIDQPGIEGARAAASLALQAAISSIVINLAEILDPLSSEKDLRDYWLRKKDTSFVRNLLRSLAPKQIEPPRPSKVSIASFMAMQVPTQPWDVEGIWLSHAIGMIVGAPKMGKSWLSLDLGISIASGLPFLGSFPIMRPGPVVYITKEDPENLLQDRLAKILIAKGLGGDFSTNGDHRSIKVRLPTPLSAPLYLDLSREFFFTPENVSDLILWLRDIKYRHGEISLVIFDPILRMMAGVDEFKATEVGGSVFSSAERIRSEIGSGVLLVHHKGKGASGQGKGSYGSMAFHAFSEASLFLQGDEPGDEGWVPVQGEYKSSAETAWSYRFTELEDCYKVESELGTKKSSGGRLIGSISQMLKSLAPDGMLVDQIADCLDGVSEQTIRGVLKSLESDGRVRREKVERAPGVKGGPKPDKWFSTEV